MLAWIVRSHRRSASETPQGLLDEAFFQNPEAFEPLERWLEDPANRQRLFRPDCSKEAAGTQSHKSDRMDSERRRNLEPTSKMIDAGAAALEWLDDQVSKRAMAEEVFRAMVRAAEACGWRLMSPQNIEDLEAKIADEYNPTYDTNQSPDY